MNDFYDNYSSGYDYLQGQAVDIQQQIAQVQQSTTAAAALPVGSEGQVYIADSTGNPTPANATAGDSNGAALAVVGGQLVVTLTQALKASDSPTFVKITPTNLTAQLAALGLPLGKYNATAAPTVNDDSGDGYSVGSIWVDTTAKDAYILCDSTIGAAVWKKISP